MVAGFTLIACTVSYELHKTMRHKLTYSTHSAHSWRIERRKSLQSCLRDKFKKLELY